MPGGTLGKGATMASECRDGYNTDVALWIVVVVNGILMVAGWGLMGPRLDKLDARLTQLEQRGNDGK